MFEERDGGELVARRDGAVRTLPLAQGGFAFLTACGRGDTLAEAALDGLGAEPALDLSVLFAALVEIGAFADLLVVDVQARWAKDVPGFIA